MPLIRIDIPAGISFNIKKEIHTKARQVVIKTLAPKEVKYDYVSIREAFGFVGDGLPVIEVDLRPGRDAIRRIRKLFTGTSITATQTSSHMFKTLSLR